MSLVLKGFTFKELLSQQGLQRLDDAFLRYLQSADQQLVIDLTNYRQQRIAPGKPLSEFLIGLAPYVENFIAELFQIDHELAALNAATLSHDPIFVFKKYYVLRQARRNLSRAEALDFAVLHKALLTQLDTTEDLELAVACYGQKLLVDAVANAKQIAALTDWCIAAMTSVAGQQCVKHWVSFKLPQKVDYQHLVATEVVADDPLQRLQAPVAKQRQRDGFQLTDARMSAREVQNEVHYCVYCHRNGDDFCSHGFPNKKSNPESGLKINPLDELLTGCPLDEKISEMNYLKKVGHAIAALAVVMVDNPMCPITGHRICNDCMKACIYQKQDPVDIPQIETRVLTDVLSLPWGVEIYDLLTRWNPLRAEQYLPKPFNHKKVLVMGMGPAGFTLAHHLLMEGCAVVGVDGLKLEPLTDDAVFSPIRDFANISDALDKRITTGFGGVAEYGITVRWDKNFLQLIYINLIRRSYFQAFGSVRFGGTVTVEQVWQLGFDHLALAVGAGLPRELNIPHSLAPGMRQANDFLMSLQLTGAAKASSMTNLQVRLPAVIIGGGLTAIDTATEVQAYYIRQVEKTLSRYQILCQQFGETALRARFDAAQLEILDEFVAHGLQVQKEREIAECEQRAPNFIDLIHGWGGVTIAYRRQLSESPAYRRNHEEVNHALAEGVFYLQGMQPTAVKLNQHGWVAGLVCQAAASQREVVLPAQSIFVATGAKPNVAYEFEHQGTFLRQGFQYRRFKLNAGELIEINAINHVKSPDIGFFTSYLHADHRVSFIGDTHPTFHGSVVKAIASAKRAYPLIMTALQLTTQTPSVNYSAFRATLTDLFRARVVSVQRHTAKIVELKVRAPLAARSFQAGQFYRIQNYETLTLKHDNTRLQTEALALIGIVRPTEPDVIAFMVSERGVSSRLVANFMAGQPISVMGPTGARSKIPSNQTVMILGNELAVAHLLSVGRALKQAGNQIIFIGCFTADETIFCEFEVRELADVVHYGSQLAELVRKLANDSTIRSINRVNIIGSSRLIREWQTEGYQALQSKLTDDYEAFAAVYGPMQCMLKGVCAQCLQWQIDPVTLQRKKAVYACSWQNQPLTRVDINNIDERLEQNRLQEILAAAWLDYLQSIGGPECSSS